MAKKKVQTQVLNYRVIVEPDRRTGTNEPCFTASCPTLGVASDGDSIEEALTNMKDAIDTYVDFLAHRHEAVPTDNLEKEILATTQVRLNRPADTF